MALSTFTMLETITTIQFQNVFIIPNTNSTPIKQLPIPPYYLCSPLCLYELVKGHSWPYQVWLKVGVVELTRESAFLKPVSQANSTLFSRKVSFGPFLFTVKWKDLDNWTKWLTSGNKLGKAWASMTSFKQSLGCQGESKSSCVM